MKQLKVKTSWLKRMESLSDAECGRLFRGMLQYASTGTVPSLSGSERIVWAVAMDEIDDQLTISEKRAEAGRIGGSKSKQTEANESKPKQTIANDSKEKALPPNPPVKEKSIKKTSPKGESKESPLDAALTAFREMRNRMRKPMTPYAVDLLVQKLQKLSPDEQGQVAILKQSIENGWTGVYPVKQDVRRERNTLKNYDEYKVSGTGNLQDIDLDLEEL